MPRNPSLEQRAAWHLEHSRECGCRPVPATLLALVRRLRAARKAKPRRRPAK